MRGFAQSSPTTPPARLKMPSKKVDGSDQKAKLPPSESFVEWLEKIYGLSQRAADNKMKYAEIHLKDPAANLTELACGPRLNRPQTAGGPAPHQTTAPRASHR